MNRLEACVCRGEKGEEGLFGIASRWGTLRSDARSYARHKHVLRDVTVVRDQFVRPSFVVKRILARPCFPQTRGGDWGVGSEP